MKALSIRNLPDDVYEALKTMAAQGLGALLHAVQSLPIRLCEHAPSYALDKVACKLGLAQGNQQG